MESMESCIPPGFRFHPTDEELVGYYLRKKVASQKIDLDVIRDIDLYRIEPWDLKEHCRIGYEEQSEWYFFSYKDRKYPTGTRTNRATMVGFWKATGRDKAVREKNKLIGMRKTLVFYKGRAPNGQKTDWIMHEYRLETEESAPPQAKGWVVCRAFKKRPACPSRSPSNMWDSRSSYDTSTEKSIVLDPLEYMQMQENSSLCKQEADINGLNILHYSISNPFIQLPDLESPSFPAPKRPPLVSLSSQDEQEVMRRECNVGEKVMDWRELDKFVASQLSPQESLGEAQHVTGLELGTEEIDKISAFLSPDSGIGASVFE
ncbi:hypothetical protein LUZ62_035328 [Rhynchospora pubera]|uniref:NAC domain-containing protein n=1 Tax=Rhynchospora pubera TaxID=906938 RepID=A0AAV8F1J0_9POAL|nr:hypothetical protein LUZ62_035328 [Rhynchospora pubera]